MIIGLTGKNGSGKGVVADLLIARGFVFHSLSDVIRREIQKSGEAITREKMIAVGKSLRHEGGIGVLAQKILPEISDGKNHVVDSIRNPGEVTVLKTLPDFILLSIEADQQTRFERCRVRARENEPTTLAGFIHLEDQELHSADPAAQQLVATAGLADAVIQNDGGMKELEEKLDVLLMKTPHPALPPRGEGGRRPGEGRD